MDQEIERVHAAAAAGAYLPYVAPDRVPVPHPPLAGAAYVRMRWPRRQSLDLPDPRAPQRQLRHARRAIERAREKAGLLADLYDFPTPEERVAAVRENARISRAQARSDHARELLAARKRLRELPTDIRRAVLLSWNARHLPADYLLGFIDRFLRGEIPPVPELILSADLLILGCTASRDPSPARMPAWRRFSSHTMRFAGGGSLLGRGLDIVILSGELGLLHCWESERDGRILGADGPTLGSDRAAALAGEPAEAAAFLHACLVGPGDEERPPYRRVFVGGGTLHQQVVLAWERADAFRGAAVSYLPLDDTAQRDALAAIFGISLVAPATRPAQLTLL